MIAQNSPNKNFVYLFKILNGELLQNNSPSFPTFFCTSTWTQSSLHAQRILSLRRLARVRQKHWHHGNVASLQRSHLVPASLPLLSDWSKTAITEREKKILLRCAIAAQKQLMLEAGEDTRGYDSLALTGEKTLSWPNDQWAIVRRNINVQQMIRFN